MSDEKNPGYIYYYYVNNCTLTDDLLSTAAQLRHYSDERSIVSSSYRSDGGDDYVCKGSRYDEAFDMAINGGSMYIYDGGVANSIAVNTWGYVYVNSGGEVNDAIVKKSGWIYVSSGGVANRTKVIIESGNGEAFLCVNPGGVANDTTLDRSGCLYIASGGTGSGIVTSAGKITVSSGGTAIDINVRNGSLTVSNGGTAIGIVENGGCVDVRPGASAIFVPNTFTGTISISGTVHSGTTANSVIVGPQVNFHIFSGGVANNTIARATRDYQASVWVSCGGVANSTILNGYMTIYSGGVANATVVNGHGWLCVSSGGVANSTTVNGGDDYWGPGRMTVGSSGEANVIVVNSGGVLFVSSKGGVANDTTVNSGGYLDVRGTATNIRENGGYVYLYGAVATFASNSFSGLVLNDKQSATVHSGTTANATMIRSGGTLCVYAGGLVNSTTLNRGGVLNISANGIAVSTTINSGCSLTVASGCVFNTTTVNSSGALFVYRGGEANSTIVNKGGYLGVSGTAANIRENGGYVYLYGAVATFASNSFSRLVLNDKQSATLHSGTTANSTIINSGGKLEVYNGGLADSAIVNSGGNIYISKGGRLERSFEIAGGSLYINSGVAAIYSASTVFGESAVLVNSGTIDFMVTSAAGGKEVLLNDCSKISGSGAYAITVNSDQRTGQYRLLGNAAAFSRNITIKVEDTGASATFKWNKSKYNSVKLGDRDYSLHLDDENTLCLTVGANPVRVDFDFTGVGQTVYYDGEAPTGSTLSGTLMMIPYTADVTVSFDKTLVDGEYEFTAAVSEVPGAVNNYRIQIVDGVPVYLSDNACYYGVKSGESASTVTYTISGVHDHLLIDSIPDTTLDLKAEYDDAGDAAVQADTGSIRQNYAKGSQPDINKVMYLKSFSIKGRSYANGTIDLKVTAADDKDGNKYVYSAELDFFGKKYSGSELSVDTYLSWDNSLFSVTVRTKDNSEFSINGKMISGTMDKIKVSIESTNLNVFVTDTVTASTEFAPWDVKHCWVATAVNMLAAIGYLSVSAERCFEILNKNYYIRDGGNSESSNVTRVFKDLLYGKFGWNNWKSENICHLYEGRNIKTGLDNIASGNGNIVGALSYGSGARFSKGSHVITCYEVKLDASGTSGIIRYADSDNGIDSPTLSLARILRADNTWRIVINGNQREITRLITLIGNTYSDSASPVKLSEEDMKLGKLTTPVTGGNVYAVSFDNYGTNGNTLVVNGSIIESVVDDAGDLCIAAGAEADEMVVHAGGAVTFESGSTARGTIRTAGGTITVESGADFSDAEVDFAVLRMDENVGAPLLDDIRNVSGAKLSITIVNEQRSGRYVLAGNAAEFDGTISVVGEFDYMRDVGYGFADGFIGELGLDSTLYIEGNTYRLSVEDDALVLDIDPLPEHIAEAAASLSDAENFVEGRYAKWDASTQVASGTVILAGDMTDGVARLEIDGYVGGEDTILFGASGNTFASGSVEITARSGSLRNLAAGADAGGTVGGVSLELDGADVNGVAYAGGFGSVSEWADTLITAGDFAGDFYGGALANYVKTPVASEVGGVCVTVDAENAVFYGNIYGASAVKSGIITTALEAPHHTVGHIGISLAEGKTAKEGFCLFAGGYATGHDSSTGRTNVYETGSVNLYISGGEWGTVNNGRGIFGGIFTGDNISDTELGETACGVRAEAGDVNISISGGSMGNVYGGGWAQRNGTSVVGNVDITVSGGTVANIFGGGSTSTSGGATVTGDVTITVDGGSITGAIYAMGQGGNDSVEGDVSVTFRGANDYVCGVYGYSYVGGAASEATLSFTGYTGKFSGRIGGFAGITFSADTAMELGTAAAHVSNYVWNFDVSARDADLSDTAMLDWHAANFAGDTIVLNLASGSTAAWTLVDAAATTAYGEFDVRIDGVSQGTLKLGDQLASGEFAGWGFTIEDTVLKFKNLA